MAGHRAIPDFSDKNQNIQQMVFNNLMLEILLDGAFVNWNFLPNDHLLNIFLLIKSNINACRYF